MSKSNRWVDVTPYARGERGVIEPRTWRIQIGNQFEVSVHRHSHYPPDVWVVSCYAIAGLTCHELSARDLHEAQAEALAVVKARLERWMNAVSAAEVAT